MVLNAFRVVKLCEPAKDVVVPINYDNFTLTKGEGPEVLVTPGAPERRSVVYFGRQTMQAYTIRDPDWWGSCCLACEFYTP